jgi:hypothetical protein
MGTELPEPGVCVGKPATGNNMFFGPAEKSALNDAAGMYLEKCFADGGLVPKYYDDVRPYFWKNATSTSGFNTVCAILRLTIGEVYADPNGVSLSFGTSGRKPARLRRRWVSRESGSICRKKCRK